MLPATPNRQPLGISVMRKTLLFLLLGLLLNTTGCSPSDVKEAADVSQGVPRKTIDQDIMGVNAFANDGRFGTQSSQFGDIRSNLGLRFITDCP